MSTATTPTIHQHQHASAAVSMPTTIFQDYGGVLGTNTIVPNWDTNPEDICVALSAQLLYLHVQLTACVNQLTLYIHTLVNCYYLESLPT